MSAPAKILFRLIFFLPLTTLAQIDPVARDLIQAGYNQAFEGHAPLAAYGFYYHNQPDFMRTNLTLRLAVAPVYLDSNLGFVNGLGPNTDFAVGLAGGGFGDSYNEIRDGTYYTSESFEGNGVEGSASIYHLFNPADRIPLNGVLRAGLHEAFYERDAETAPNFTLPEDRQTFTVRTGLRWGGKEPLLTPDAGLELSGWYEAQFRNDTAPYGFNGDRIIQRDTHLFWGRALLAYTLPGSEHHFEVSMLGGASVRADRFSAYRLGSVLPFTSEFPLNLPGYYNGEISARKVILWSGLYTVPLDHAHDWRLAALASTALVDYTTGMEQPGHWLSGVGGGVFYDSPSRAWEVGLGYGYGIDAIREGHRGAHSVALLVQFNLEKVESEWPASAKQPERSRGLLRFLGNVFR